MVVIIARHGERVDLSDAEGWMVSEGRATRPWDPQLTKNGKRQARCLGRRIREEITRLNLPSDIQVFASPLTRTVETAEGVIQGLEDEALQIHTEPGLLEALCEDWYKSWCYPKSNGHWGGPDEQHADNINKNAYRSLHELVRSPQQLHSSVSNLVSTEYKSISSLPDVTIENNLESFPSCFSRVAAFLQKLQTLHANKTIVCISHGAPLTGMYNFLSGEDSTVWTEYCGLYVFKPDGRNGHQLVAEGDSHTAE